MTCDQAPKDHFLLIQVILLVKKDMQKVGYLSFALMTLFWHK
jgi:hypothetical protein